MKQTLEIIWILFIYYCLFVFPHIYFYGDLGIVKILTLDFPKEILTWAWGSVCALICIFIFKKYYDT